MWWNRICGFLEFFAPLLMARNIFKCLWNIGSRRVECEHEIQSKVFLQKMFHTCNSPSQLKYGISQTLLRGLVLVWKPRVCLDSCVLFPSGKFWKLRNCELHFCTMPHKVWESWNNSERNCSIRAWSWGNTKKCPALHRIGPTYYSQDLQCICLQGWVRFSWE